MISSFVLQMCSLRLVLVTDGLFEIVVEFLGHLATFSKCFRVRSGETVVARPSSGEGASNSASAVAVRKALRICRPFQRRALLPSRLSKCYSAKARISSFCCG